MESFFGSNPWDFGTGFTQQPSFAPGAGAAPVMPQTDLTGGLAQAFASQGIRPGQFMANPQAAASALQPPGPPANAGSNPWDPTPVDTPGGPAVNLNDGRRVDSNPNIQTDDAQAAASPEDKASGGKSMGDKLAETLKGVKMPQPPAPQKVSSPHAPEPKGQIKSGELLSMLLAMHPESAKLGPTLGASLKGVY